MIMNIFSKIISAVLCVMTYTACANQNRIYYAINSLDSTNHCLDIAIESNFDQNGDYSLAFPMGSRAFTISNPNQSIQLIDTDSPYRKKLKGLPGEKLEVQYKYCLNNPKRSIEWPIIEKDYFLFKFDKVLAIPLNNINENWKINIDISKLPKHFSIFSSFDGSVKNISSQIPMEKFKNAILVAGDIRFEKIIINKKPVILVSLDAIKSLPKGPAFYFEHLINTQRSFWQDNDFEHYLIVLLERSCKEISPGPAGIHHENSIIFQLTHCNEELDYRNIHGISHELFHAWLGIKMPIALPQGSLQWFIEGITDYFGLYMALKSGLIKEEQYFDLYNQLIRCYYLLPINHISNDQIIKNYGKDPYFHQLAQLRGHFYAKTLASTPKLNKSLNLIIKEIYQAYQKQDGLFLEQKIIDKTFHKRLSKKLWKNYIDVIYNGELIKFSDKDFKNTAILSDTVVEVPDIGFNMLDLIINQKISQIDDKSPAYIAGVRNGQEVVSHSINLINTNRNMSVWIKENDKIREISFLPNKKKAVIPQYSLPS